MSGYCKLPGTEINGDSLVIEKALDLWNFLSRGLHTYARPVSARRFPNGSEGVVFEVDPELPQVRRFPINSTERLATLFSAMDDHTPETLALRDDFPLVPHINPRETEFPRSLCIYEESYDELRLHWTSARHVERVRAWLADNAEGKLHRADQPLEQIFIDALVPLIVPSDFPRGVSDGPLYISICDRENNQPIVFARRVPTSDLRPAVPVIISAPPQESKYVRTLPKNLQALHELLKGFEINLMAELSGRRKGIPSSQRDYACVVIVIFPLLRKHGGDIERYDIWAFAVVGSVEKVGEAAGIWQRTGDYVGGLIGQMPNEEALKHLEVLVLNPMALLSRELAARFNRTSPSEKRLLAIGVGALGSACAAKLRSRRIWCLDGSRQRFLGSPQCRAP